MAMWQRVLKVVRQATYGPVAAEARKCSRNGNGEEGTAKRCHRGRQGKRAVHNNSKRSDDTKLLGQIKHAPLSPVFHWGKP